MFCQKYMPTQKDTNNMDTQLIFILKLDTMQLRNNKSQSFFATQFKEKVQITCDVFFMCFKKLSDFEVWFSITSKKSIYLSKWINILFVREFDQLLCEMS